MIAYFYIIKSERKAQIGGYHVIWMEKEIDMKMFFKA